MVPVMTTVCPIAALAGIKPLSVAAGGTKVKPFKLNVPPAVWTLTAPEEPLLPTTAVIWVAELTTNDAASKAPNLTRVAPVRFVPVITTEAPADERLGVNDVIRGAAGSAMNVKPLRLEVPPCVITFTAPETAEAEM